VTISKRIQIAAGAVLINGVAAYSLLSAPPAAASTCMDFDTCIPAVQCSIADIECLIYNSSCQEAPVQAYCLWDGSCGPDEQRLYCDY
jgi:hypothetical protein